MTDAASLARAVFLDRDGTVNVERDYLHRSEDFTFIPGAPAAIRLLREAGYRIVVVTNQSGIARGYYDEEALHRIHRHMDELLSREGAAVDAYYHCPHHPDGTVDRYRAICDCRKPLPGMLRQAAADLHLDLSVSYIIGDKLADVEAGQAAGCRPILVETGYGATEKALIGSDVPVFSSIVEAASWIVSGR
jgi:D-glycero-D-manno-heptose 1,7-bisphosphate phosphatase